MKVKRSTMRSSATAARSPRTTSRFVDSDGSLTDITIAHRGGSSAIGKHLQVFVRDNNVDQALRVLKKKIATGGRFSRDEASQGLRKAVRAQGSREIRGDRS